MERTRRQLLLQAAAMIGGQAMWHNGMGLAMQFTAEHPPDLAMLEGYRQVSHTLASQVNVGDPSQVAAQLRGHYMILDTALQDCARGERRELLAVLGHTQAVRGLAASALGKRGEARAHLNEAEMFLREAGDDSLRALVGVWRADLDSAVQAGLGRPSPGAVLDDLTKAQGLLDGSSPHALATYVLMRLAEEYAAVGADGAAERCLEGAYTAWSRLQGGQGYLYGMVWTGELTRAFCAHVYLLLGGVHIEDAVVMLSDVVQTDNEATSDHVAALTDLAASLLVADLPGESRSGALEQACECLGRAYRLAAAMQRQDRMERVKGVISRIRPAQRSAAPVLRLQELIAS